jgi:hypothetical protein
MKLHLCNGSHSATHLEMCHASVLAFCSLLSISVHFMKWINRYILALCWDMS